MAKRAYCSRAWSLALTAGLMASGAVLTATGDAAAQSRGRDRVLVDPTYREPVYAPRRAVPKLTGKRLGKLPLDRAPAGKAQRAKAAIAASAKPSVAAGAAAAVAVAASAATPATGATVSAPASAPPAASGAPAVAGVPMTMEQFLDRLMIAESGGRLEAKNPRSSATGPFQFIESTFIAVAKRNFAAEIADKTPEQILALRTDMAFSRKAAEAYTRENAVVLKSNDVEPTYPNLRLAFLLGAGGAVKVLRAPPASPLSTLLSPAVLIANPFMLTMTASSLAARSAREVWQPVNSTAGVVVPPGTPLPKRVATGPVIPVHCNLRLPSCKRWLALQTSKVRGTTKRAAVSTGRELSGAMSGLGGPKR